MANIIQTLTRDIRSLDEEIKVLQGRRNAMAATLEHYSKTDASAFEPTPAPTTPTINKGSLKERMLEYLQEHGPANVPTLADVLGVPQQRTSIHRAVTQLEQANKVRRLSDRTVSIYEGGA